MRLHQRSSIFSSEQLYSCQPAQACQLYRLSFCRKIVSQLNHQKRQLSEATKPRCTIQHNVPVWEVSCTMVSMLPLPPYTLWAILTFDYCRTSVEIRRSPYAMFVHLFTSSACWTVAHLTHQNLWPGRSWQHVIAFLSESRSKRLRWLRIDRNSAQEWERAG